MKPDCLNDELPKDFCFCTLALGKKYRLLTQQLARDLSENFPGGFLVVYTDKTEDFINYTNVLAYKHQQKGILTCFNDKRFVIAKALSHFEAAIFIDADTRIISRVAAHFNWMPGITTGHCEKLLEHVRTYSVERLEALRRVASKLNLDLENVNYVGESLFVIARDQGKEIEFFQQWDRIARYVELKGIHAGEGNVIGLAAAKVGWSIHSDNHAWQAIKQVTKHLDASQFTSKQTFWEQWQMRIGYHYRLNQARLMALKDFDFFYK